jgi:hypothetical protein
MSDRNFLRGSRPLVREQITDGDEEFSFCAMAGCDQPKAKYSPWCDEHSAAPESQSSGVTVKPQTAPVTMSSPIITLGDKDT